MFDISYNEALEQHRNQFYGGAEYVPTKANIIYDFPFGELYKGEDFVTQTFEIKNIKSKIMHPELVDIYCKYLEIAGAEVEPIWLSAGRKMKNGKISRKWHNMLSIMDGNHRVEAAKKLGWSWIVGVMPESHFYYYMKNINSFGVIE
jgi:hypothetical protein